jgi:hypothetical protein
MPTWSLDDQWTNEGLFVNDMEQKARGTAEKMGDAGLGCVDGTFNTRNESHNYW